MDDYWTLDLVFCRLVDPDYETLTVSHYNERDGRRDIARWIDACPVDEADIENILELVKTFLVSRLNVQLGLDLGLLS